MIEYVRSQIKKIRAEKRLTQKSVGDDIGLGKSGFSKIETGPGKLDVERLAMIAHTLKVDIAEFFPKSKAANKLEESQKNYGYANKTDIEDLAFLIKQLKSEMISLKKEIAAVKKVKPVKKK